VCVWRSSLLYDEYEPRVDPSLTGPSLVDSETRHHPLLVSFPLVIAVPVQWGDQDAFGHVNNTVPFRWFESARIAYSRRIGLFDLFQAEQIGPILAATSCKLPPPGHLSRHCPGRHSRRSDRSQQPGHGAVGRQ